MRLLGRFKAPMFRRFFLPEKVIHHGAVPDLDALFVIAGPCGSGKSTLLKAALEEDLPLYGTDLVDCFQSSCKEDSFRDFCNHELASRTTPYFQARHVMLLGREDVLPEVVLLHIDLYQLLREIDPSYLLRLPKKCGLWREAISGERIEKEGVCSGTIKRSQESLMVSVENDQLLCSYFQDPFFQRFKRIFVNTVYCDYSMNAVQLSNREARRGKNSRPSSNRRFKFFRAPEKVSRSIHKELYASWERNLSLLSPVTIFRTQVDESGDLLLNGSIIAEGWSKRFE